MVKRLELELGKSVLLHPAYEVRRVSVGDPEIADIVVLNSRELQLVAKEVGETNVVLWDEGGRAQAAIDLEVARPYAGIEAELRRVSNNDDVRVVRVSESIVVKGSVANTAAMDRAMRVAHAFFPEEKDEGNVINLLEVGGNQQVMIEVTIAEMSRQVTREMETNFAAMVQSGNSQLQLLGLLSNLVIPDDGAGSPLGVLLSNRVNLLANFQQFGDASATTAFNFLQERGLVKILAEPTLLARSGQSASFLAGGEVPIPIAQGGAFGSITIEFKQFGVRLDFTPTVLSADRIHMEITPEVSEPDFTLGTTVDGTSVPGFRTRRASTGVELGDGQSFAIAGLLSEDIREQASQYPILGDIPVLGTLFRSKRYQKNETELVLIVRPRLAKPLPDGRPPLPTDHFVEPTDYEFYLTNALEGRPREEDVPSTLGVSGGLLGAAGHRISIEEAEKELQ
jgi:pilus assembly protein CpaC